MATSTRVVIGQWSKLRFGFSINIINHVSAKVEGERLDEIKEYVDTRVMCANEAAAGIFGFETQYNVNLFL